MLKRIIVCLVLISCITVFTASESLAMSDASGVSTEQNSISQKIKLLTDQLQYLSVQLTAKKIVGDWETVNIGDMYSISYPKGKGWYAEDLGNANAVFGRTVIKNDFSWSVRSYQNSPEKMKELIQDMGKQFPDRKVATKNIKLKGVRAKAVTVTTKSVSDWAYEALYIDGKYVGHPDRLFVITNGAVKNPDFRKFYKSIKFKTPVKKSKTAAPLLKSPEITKNDPVRPVDKNDHIKGNPNAPIIIVEYSDFNCPFCKNFHETMNAVMDTYGANGKVAWVYRQFPLEQLYPNSPKIAQASECVALLAGNDAFWKFSDRVFGEREVNEQTDMTRLTEFAVASGASKTAYNSCMEYNRTKAAVDEDFKDGVNAGAKGTPYSLVLVGGQKGVINGAQPFEYIKSVLDTLISQMDD